jgi:GTP1/Obg family GTP-binding protein
MKTTWKDIAPVPTSQEFLDIVLSRTQRRLPTQIRAGFKISRIRGVYHITSRRQEDSVVGNQRPRKSIGEGPGKDGHAKENKETTRTRD